MLHLSVFFISVVIITGSENTGSDWPFRSNHPAHTQLPMLCRIKRTLFSRPSTLTLLPATSSGNLLFSSVFYLGVPHPRCVHAPKRLKNILCGFTVGLDDLRGFFKNINNSAILYLTFPLSYLKKTCRD